MRILSVLCAIAVAVTANLGTCCRAAGASPETPAGNAGHETLTEESLYEKISHHIKHANTYYLFGIVEKGHLHAFEEALHHLDHAEHLLSDDVLSEDTFRKAMLEIEALKSSLPLEQAVREERIRAAVERYHEEPQFTPEPDPELEPELETEPDPDTKPET